MSSKARASCPSSSLLRRLLEATDPAGEHGRGDVPDDERGEEGDQTGDDEPAPDLVDALQRVVERGPQEHDGAVSQRITDLRKPPTSRRYGPADRPGIRVVGADGERVILDVGRRHRTGVLEDGQLERVRIEQREVHDAGVRALGRCDDRVVELRVRGFPEPPGDGRSGLAQLAEFRVDQVVLERRNDDQVDEQQRPRENHGKRKRQPPADGPKRVHRSRKR
jgi:hypothetical protein